MSTTTLSRKRATKAATDFASLPGCTERREKLSALARARGKRPLSEKEADQFLAKFQPKKPLEADNETIDFAEWLRQIRTEGE